MVRKGFIIAEAKIPNPDDIYPNEYKTSCFIKNVVSAPNIRIGEYT